MVYEEERDGGTTDVMMMGEALLQGNEPSWVRANQGGVTQLAGSTAKLLGLYPAMTRSTIVTAKYLVRHNA